MSISSTGSSSALRLSRAAGAAGLLLFVASGAAAQDPNLVDQGRYDIVMEDGSTGTETFAIRRQGEGYMAVGRIQVRRENGWLRSAEFGLRTDGAFAPVRFETRALGRPPHRLIVTRSGTRLRITTSGDEGDRMTELLATPDQVLLAPGIAQHYYFVVRRLMASGDRVELVAILPGSGHERPVRLVSVGNAEVSGGAQTLPARRYELDVGDVRHIVWADPADGRVLRVEVPEHGWSSVRQTGD